MKAAVIEIVDYEDWIKSLGNDREWIVQIKQSEFSKNIHEEIAKLDGFAFPLRYDFSIVLIDGIKCDAENFYDKLRETGSRIFPLDIRVAVGFDLTLKGAQSKATKLLVSKKGEFFLDDFRKPNEKIVAIHIDVNSFKDRTKIGVYESYQEMMELYLSISHFIEKIGGLTCYLGGDNILAFTSIREIKYLMNLVRDRIKIGVGIAENPRKALALASQSLESIRLGKCNEKGIKVILSR
jgi:GTP cyclohydrolase IIa